MIQYHYDELGQLFGLRYNEVDYIYQRDIFGSIMGIIDLEGKVFVSYTYNGFGEPSIDVQTEGMTLNDLVVASKLKEHNIYIYKGYIYDQDTKMYYLNSRYYDPRIGRFITPDDPSYLSVENINGLNLYAYCGNNPVMYLDSSGHSWESFWKTTFGVMAGIAIGAVAVTAIIASGGTLLVPALIGLGIGAGFSLIGQGLANVSNGRGFFEDVNWMSVAMGGVSGFAFATGVGGLFGAIGIGALSSAGSSAFEGESWGNIGINALLGGAAAGIGYGAGKFLGNHIFKNSDLVFNDIFQMTRLDTNIVNAAVIAFRATWYTFIPALTPGITRGIINYLGN